MSKEKKKVTEQEHPKTQIEFISNTMDAVTGFATAKQMSTMEASLVLILNELRCIHWHFDNGIHIILPNPEEKKKP